MDFPRTFYGGFYEYGNTTPSTNNKTDVYHGFHCYFVAQTLAHLSGWSYVQTPDAKANATFASVADGGDGTAVVTCGADHGLLPGDTICMQTTGGTEYDKKYVVGAATGNARTFKITSAVNTSRAGFWQQPSYLLAGAGSAGIYFCGFNATGDSTTNGHSFRMELNVGGALAVADQDQIAADGTWSSGTDWRNLAASGMITVAVGDSVFLSFKGLSSAGNILWRHSNVNLHKVI